MMTDQEKEDMKIDVLNGLMMGVDIIELTEENIIMLGDRFCGVPKKDKGWIWIYDEFENVHPQHPQMQDITEMPVYQTHKKCLDAVLYLMRSNLGRLEYAKNYAYEAMLYRRRLNQKGV